MNKFPLISILAIAFMITSCDETLEPPPVDLLVDNVVLNEPADVPGVEIGLYAAFRSMTPSIVIAGDATSDNLVNNGTFTHLRELGTKQITSANASVGALWAGIYSTVYIANFILERLPEVPGVNTSERQRVMATAHFLRGFAYFTGAYTFGGMPLATTTSIETNRNIPRASLEETLNFVLEDYTASLNKLSEKPSNPGFAGDEAVRAALARFYLYQQDWTQAAQYADQVISSELYSLDDDYETIVKTDFPKESIFEAGYSAFDDPGTSSTQGLNDLFVGRRELIPSNQMVLALDPSRSPSGDRFSSIKFDAADLSGSDNGWSVAKYGTADEDNNNIVVFRLGEMYLIRAEARAHLGLVSGAGSAQEDLNVLRLRSNAVPIPVVNQSQMFQLIEDERRYELAFEGHRWYDLVRTGRANTVMSSFITNWKSTYQLWPIPQREILNNPSLAGHQNPGY